MRQAVQGPRHQFTNPYVSAPRAAQQRAGSCIRGAPSAAGAPPAPPPPTQKEALSTCMHGQAGHYFYGAAQRQTCRSGGRTQRGRRPRQCPHYYNDARPRPPRPPVLAWPGQARGFSALAFLVASGVVSWRRCLDPKLLAYWATRGCRAAAHTAPHGAWEQRSARPFFSVSALLRHAIRRYSAQQY